MQLFLTPISKNQELHAYLKKSKLLYLTAPSKTATTHKINYPTSENLAFLGIGCQFRLAARLAGLPQRQGGGIVSLALFVARFLQGFVAASAAHCAIEGTG